MLTPSNITRRKRVLIGTPHSDKKNYCIEDYIARVKSFTYPYYDLLIVDNSDTRKNYKLLQKEGFNVIYVKPKKKRMQEILAESHEIIRDFAVKHNYDYLLHFEDDLVPPTNVIERLMIHNLPIVSAMYMINFGRDSHLMAQEMETFGDIRETINLKDGSDLMFVDGTVKEVFSHGLGCCLIHKNVLKQFNFRSDKSNLLHPDSIFSYDINYLGIPKYIDTSILAQHNNSKWIFI